MLRFLTAGESHGKAEVAILEGIPAGLGITEDEINRELEKRKLDFGRGKRGLIEKDKVEILSGVRLGKTIGSPIALMVKNFDFDNWQNIMATGKSKQQLKPTKPRPGHADMAGVLKYGFDDIRNVLERASARETIMRVALGAICKKFLAGFDIQIASHTLQIGQAKNHRAEFSFEEISNVFKIDPDFRCCDKIAREKMKNEIISAQKNKDTLGGVVEIIARHVPIGLGSHVHYDRKLDGKIAQALMSIPSVKAVEIGNGIESARQKGSETHDSMIIKGHNIFRKTNQAGGIEGGISNGENIICRVFHKPLATLLEPLSTIDIETLKNSKAITERSDICAVARAGVISEAMLAFVLSEVLLEKFGGDNLRETKTNFNNYLKSLKIK